MYCVHLDQPKAAVYEKCLELTNRKGVVVFHQDNAKSPVSLITHSKSLQFVWDVLFRPL